MEYFKFKWVKNRKYMFIAENLETIVEYKEEN